MFTNVQEAEKISAYSDIKETLLSAKKLEWPDLALQVFHLQHEHNPVYRQWCDHLHCQAEEVKNIEDIPFLPIDFFKQERLSIISQEPKGYFRSSGTGGYGQSKHAVYDLDFYDRWTKQSFEDFYAPVEDFCILALLPAYLEREGSSLVRMAQHFIYCSKDSDSGFFLNDLERLAGILKSKQAQGSPTLLLGVSFALWDLAEQYPMDLSDVIIMETGGMKGRRKELIRADLHRLFSNAFDSKSIHSEYGMTELFSQAYSQGGGRFRPSPGMKVIPRQMEDPFSRASYGRSAGLNIIDLANVHSCAFIETQDLGRVYADGSFEVLGRFDRSEVRGCNLMLS